MPVKKIRLLVVDDHSMMRVGLATAINVEPDMTVVAEATSGEQALELYRRHQPDLVLMDLRLPGMSGDQATARLCREFAGAKVLMLSKHDSPAEISRCARAGARSFLSKSLPLEELLQAIRTIHAGQPYLPPALATHLLGQPRGALSAQPGSGPRDHPLGSKQFS